MMKMWRRTHVAAVVAAGCCVAGVMVAGVVPAVAASAAAAVFVPLGPVRVMDTRNGTGVAKAPLGPGQSVSLQVDGVDGVPSTGVTAVVLNVTAVGPTASSDVTVYPDGQTRPGTSNLNFTRGETIANLVVVPVGADGKVDFYNYAGSVNLVADLSGYDTDSGSGSLLGSIGPVRVMDTRNGTGVPKAAVGPGKSVSLQVAGVDGVPAAGLTAVVLNVTAVGPTASSDVTVYPDGQTRPGTSNLNFTRGETIPNQVIVPVGTDGKVDFYNYAGSVNLVADLSGYYTAAGAGLTGVGPVRVMDTRNGTGVAKAPVGAGKSVSLQVAGVDGVPSTGVTAVVLNVTAVDATASSDVIVYPDGQTRPATSSLNFTRGETIPNLVVVPVGTDGKVDFYNYAGSVNLVADLSGYYTAGGATWGNSTQIPGLAALNTGGFAGVNSVSCPSAGDCTAGGYYTDSSGSGAFVADEVNGTWGTAIEVPGTATLNSGNNAQIESVSCASAGNCAAGGSYLDGSSNQQAFVADEVNGTWDTAIEVPGTATLNTVRALVNSVSCASAGNCTAGGSYTDGSSNQQAFVADEVNGTWGTAIEVPDAASLGTGANTPDFSVSCPSAGNCTAGGSYTNSSGVSQAFVASEVNGTWGNAIQVPGSAALNTAGSATVTSVSCASAGNCSAGGQLVVGSPSSGSPQPFAVSEVNGTWGNAIQVPGIPSIPGGVDSLTSVSCASAGNCVAGGYYGEVLGPDNVKAFVVSEVNGTWGEPIQIPEAFAFAGVYSVSCPPTGGCTAGGTGETPFIASQN